MYHLLFQPVYKELIPSKRSSKDKSGPVEDTMIELMTHVKEKAASKELDISKFLEVNHLCVIVSLYERERFAGTRRTLAESIRPLHPRT